VAFEPNYVAGFANRRIAPFVTAAAVQFEHTAKLFRKGEVTGVPIRREFFEIAVLSDIREPNLLVFGGSQGARAINQAMIAALPMLADRMPELRIVHQTGPRDFESTRAAYAGLPAGSRLATSEVLEFIDDMPRRFQEAQVVVCRSGANTAAEVAAAGRAAIFVPLPTAADDHQTKNAQALVQAGAAELLPQVKLTPESLVENLVRLFADSQELIRMATQVRALAKPGAAKRIAELAVDAANHRGHREH
jgi:UDP-N-acetylglucosamine--N-acetylmuramyl-(pentapeptide) pyrophosphoryl-undecaprenol N-acetylglucosamine transferase